MRSQIPFCLVAPLTCLLALAACSTARAPSAPIALPVARDPAADAKSELLWESWYTVTVTGPTGKRISFAYYLDRAERTQGRIRFQNQIWKKEEGFVNEESLGAFAQDDAALTPLFFNFRSAYRDSETTIDGTVGEKRSLSVRARRGGQDLPLIQRTLPTGVMFSSHFPLWLHRRLAELKPDRWVSFATVLEDNLEAGYATMDGRVRLEKEDATARRLGARRITVHYRDQDSVWYVDAQGVPLRIELTAQRATVERVTEKQARAFLADPSASE
jgi:hypothetical protein